MRRVRAVAAVVALLAPLASACSSETHDGLVPDARPADVDGTQLWVQLPTGRVTVTVGAPVSTIPAAEVGGGQAIDAGGGREFLPVAVAYDDLVGVPHDAPQADTDPTELTRLDLHVGERTHRVPFAEGGRTSYLEVAKGASDDLRLDVAFDGVAQSVDAAGQRVTGVAAGLYDASTRTALESCGEQVERTCRYNLWEYPYVEGLGWASQRQPDATWVVATAQTWLRADQVRVGGEACRPAAMGGSIAVRVDAGTPTEELSVAPNRRAGGHGLGARAAFLLAPADHHTLEVASTWGCRLGDRSADREFVDRVSAPS